jgi:hypothetical protein
MGAKQTLRKPPLFTCLILSATLLGGAPARAEGKRTSSLAWVRLDGAEGCVAAPSLAHAVETRLGRKVFVSPADADITVEGSIGRAQPVGFRAVLKVSARDGTILGTREVETRAAKCDAIDEKLALVVSVLIDPDGTGPAPEAEAPAPPPAPVVVERERVVVVHEDSPAPPPPPWRFELTLGVAGALGLQPDVGFAFAPSVVVAPPRFWAFVIGGGIAAPTSAAAERGATIDASLAYGVLALCPLAAERGRLHAIACAGGLVGELRGHGNGFDTTASTDSLTAGPLVLGRFTVELVGPLVASLATSLVVPLARAELAYSTPLGESTAFKTSQVAGTAELGLGVRLP